MPPRLFRGASNSILAAAAVMEEEEEEEEAEEEEATVCKMYMSLDWSRSASSKSV